MDTYLARIGTLIRDARRHQGLTQSDLADSLGTSQSAVARIEQGKQNLEMLAWIGEALDSEFVSLGHTGPQHLRIVGGTKFSRGHRRQDEQECGRRSLLRAALLNKGRTTPSNLARIEEVNRILEVLASIGVRTRWLPNSNDLEIAPAGPARPGLSMDLDRGPADQTIMFLGPLLHDYADFQPRMPVAATSGCGPSSRT